MSEAPHHTSNLPDLIMVWFGQWPLNWAGTWATKRYQADAVAYVPKAKFDAVKAAAQLGLDMAKANRLINTAETIQDALEKAKLKPT